MLVLTRRVGERIVIGENIEIVILRATNGRARVGVDAPVDVRIRRGEVPSSQETTKPVPPAR